VKESLRLIKQAIAAGRKYSREGLLYEAAYRYGQAAAMIAMLYAQHAAGEIVIDELTQSILAPLRQRLELMVESLARSAGNGHHKMGSRESGARESLLRVIEMLIEDVRGAQW
jgi:hypothetical protein